MRSSLDRSAVCFTVSLRKTICQGNGQLYVIQRLRETYTYGCYVSISCLFCLCGVRFSFLCSEVVHLLLSMISNKNEQIACSRKIFLSKILFYNVKTCHRSKIYLGVNHLIQSTALVSNMFSFGNFNFLKTTKLISCLQFG